MTAEVASGIRTSINRSYNSSSGSVSYKGELAISVTTVAVTAEKAGMIVADVLATEVASAAAS